MANNSDSSCADIGFGKPPKATRFRKGFSGNPKGRPKGKRNLATVLEQTLREKVVIDDDGVCRTVTKLEAAVKQLVDKATKGDMAALRQLITLTCSAAEQEIDKSTNQLAEADLKVMQGVLKRLEGCSKGENSED